jgi:membrane fusion protein (multidrug efflux system)
MRKLILVLIALGGLSGGAFAGWYWWTVGRFLETTDNAYVHGDISIVSPKVAGYIREVRVSDNQQVAAGDVLVVIDQADHAAQMAQAEATVEAQKAAIGSIDSRIVLARALIAQADATVVAAEAEQRRCRQDFTRLQNLVRSDFASQQRFDGADADLRKADAAVTKARAAATAERDQLGVLQASRHEAEAKLRQTEASLDLARQNLEHTIVRAPVDGVVGNRSVQLG